MREIKFRVWDGEKMRSSHSVDRIYFGPEAIRVGVDGRSADPLRIKGAWYSEGAILLQYTGMKDKNGAEIYEGDILESVHERLGLTSRLFIEWRDAAFWHVPIGGDPDDANPMDGLDGPIEVIGNIYENADLLESVSAD